MLIGVISDTHIPSRGPRIPPKVIDHFRGVDAILHAGDMESLRSLAQLEAVAPVIAVAGNMDMASPQLPITRQMTFEGRVVGLMHGNGGPRPQIRDWVRKHFSHADVIVYGHTHAAFWGEEAGVWFMNPGSPTAGLEYPSVGILEISRETLRGEIIRL